MKHATLHVIAVISNPQRYETRYDLYNKFAKHVEDSGAKLWTVETAFGDRPHEITASDHSQHIQLRTSTELWHKENMINIGISQLLSFTIPLLHQRIHIFSVGFLLAHFQGHEPLDRILDAGAIKQHLPNHALHRIIARELLQKKGAPASPLLQWTD